MYKRQARAAAAARAVQPVNGLDPTTFTSVAVMESELVAFARGMLRGPAAGPDAVVGSVTSGGTESCLLAVKIARDAARAARPEVRPRVVAPVSVHAAFRKAAQYLDVDLTLVPVDPATGTLAAADLVGALDDDVVLVVVSAPSYPHGVVDPVAEVAAAAAARGVTVTPISRFCVAPIPDRALALGFAAVPPRDIAAGVETLAAALPAAAGRP